MKLYRHYKNKPYRHLGIARHSETLEEVVLYETLYQNDLGKLWVRPRGMFEEDIDLNGTRVARFKKIPLEISVSETFTVADFKDLGEWVKGKDFFDPGPCTFVRGFVDGKCVGFWLGYLEPSGVFLSWLGAVGKEFKNLGIAQDLFMKMIGVARAKGCKIVHAQVSNSSEDLLMFYLRNHFKIIGFQSSGKVVLEHALDSSEG